MTQPFTDVLAFTDALAWVPKSRALGGTFARAHDLARAQSHPTVSLEHMLLALIEDPDASAVLLACNVDLLKVNDAVSAHLQQQPAAAGGMPEASTAVVTILEYAVAAARQSKRNEVNGAIVMAAIVGEGNSVAARLLQAQGLTFQDAVQALKRSTAQPQRPTASAAPPPASASNPLASTLPVPAPSISPPIIPSTPVPEPAQGMPQAAAQPAAIYDDDPVTTARRRIDAMRTGQPMPMSAPASHPTSPPPQTAGTSEHAKGDWAPPAQPTQAARSPRMPPPIPPLASPPQRISGSATGAAQATVPWTDPTAAVAEPPSATVIPFPSSRAGAPIDAGRLLERLAHRMKLRSANTIEVRIARSAVHATAAAMGAAPEAAVTRALTVRLRAPNGGFHVETAAPETQWFDMRGPGREEDEVRWRWIVTPHASGSHTLQLGITMRTVATDGVLIETTLPEHQANVRVFKPLLPMVGIGAALLGAAIAGGLVVLLATGGLARLFG